jgi:hypothetical protein
LRPYLKKPQHTHTHKIWLVEWLKVLALSSNPSTAKINSLRAFGVPDFSPVKREGMNRGQGFSSGLSNPGSSGPTASLKERIL